MSEQNKTLDEPATIRAGEELDAARVQAFITSSFPEITGEITVRQFPGGFSNLTYLVKIGERELILRRPPFGKKAKTAHDMAREYRVLSSLKPVFSCCPEPLVYSEDESIIGAPFYLMERIRGIILRKNLPPEISYTAEQARTLSENLVSVLCRLHSIDYEQAGLGDLGKAQGYVARQVEGWSRRYVDAKTDDAPGFETVIRWLQDKMPPDSPVAAIVHNDYRFDNVVLSQADPTEIIGVLDWEMTTIGDPLMDLGSSLAYWIEKDDPPGLQAIRMMPTNLDGMLTRDEQVSLYAEKMGIKIDNYDFYYTFGLFRLAAIAQQIYYRYYHGQTKDERFKSLIGAVKVLEQTAMQVIGKSAL